MGTLPDDLKQGWASFFDKVLPTALIYRGGPHPISEEVGADVFQDVRDQLQRPLVLGLSGSYRLEADSLLKSCIMRFTFRRLCSFSFRGFSGSFCQCSNEKKSAAQKLSSLIYQKLG